MKKTSGFILVIVMLLGVIVFTTGIAFSVDDNKHDPSTNPESPGNTGSGTNTAIYTRDDVPCPLPNPTGRQKTFCSANGNQQCTAKYCN